MSNEFGVLDNFGEGAVGLVPNYPMPDGESLIGYLRTAIGQSVKPVATLTALKAVAAKDRQANMVAFVGADQSWWRFHATSSVTGDDLLVATPSAGDGRWLRVPGLAVLSIAISKDNTNNQVLWTVPTGARVRPIDFYWGVTTGWTGGLSSAIGINSSKTGFTTAGDLLGGASGDVAATLVAGSIIHGTIGAGFDTLAKQRAVFVAGDTFKFNRITSLFTAGVGTFNIVAHVLQNAGA